VCAEGGTGPQHSQVVLRSRDVWGSYVPFEGNPILTQRDMDPARPLPITNAGHADMVEGPDGRWWSIFLASRNYGDTHYNTGRETFLLPVEWTDGWPRILAAGLEIPYVHPAPSFMQGSAHQAPLSGNFTWRDEFDAEQLDRAWMFVRVPKSNWAKLDAHAGALTIEPLAEPLHTVTNPSFLARRQQHLEFEASTAFTVPTRAGTAAGMAAFQNGTHTYFLGVHRTAAGVELFLEQRDGESTRTLTSTVIDAGRMLRLKIRGTPGAYGFDYDTDGSGWKTLLDGADGSLLSTDVAGGFVGVVLGPYARQEIK
jgi:alpha-N-arabinofuranosidase